MADVSVEAEVVTACLIIAENRCETADLTVVDPVANQVQVENLLNANHELVEMVRTLQKDVFGYFEKLLSPKLAVKWQLIVEE